MVKLGLLDDDRAEVLEGLGEGEQIIVLGQNNLEDGAAVRLAAQPREEGEEAG